MDIIKIDWSGPFKLSNLGNHSISHQSGVYAIYRKFGSSEKLIYIGMTERTFAQRMREHSSDWLYALKGEVTIRCGLLSFEQNRKFSSHKLSDAESLLIVWCKPQMNTTNYRFYYGRDNIIIHSVGRRGLVPRVIDSDDLIEVACK